MLGFLHERENYVCILCGERKRTDAALRLDGEIGICRGCASSLPRMAMSQPHKGTRSISYIIAPFEYTGALRKAVIDFKFKNHWMYAELLAYICRDYFDSYDIWDEFDMIIPVPLHYSRIHERGYNQSELLCEPVSEYLNIPMRADLLTRIRATKRQSSLGILERVANVKGAFECSEDMRGKRALLFDDICTTGNTLQACAVALEEAGAKNICAMTFAVSASNELPIITY